MSRPGSSWGISRPSSGLDAARPYSSYSRPLTMAHLLCQDTGIFVLGDDVGSDSEDELESAPSTPESYYWETELIESPRTPPTTTAPLVRAVTLVNHRVPFAYGMLHLRRMPRDGNCLFHSIAAIEGGVLDQSTYRKEVADQIRNQDNAWFACYIAPDWSGGHEAYCRYIAQDGHWGGEQEIALLAARLEIELWVFDIRSAEPKAIPYNTGSKKMVGVLVFTGNHYDTVGYHSDMGSGGVSSLFPAGCAGRLNQAVVELVRVNGISAMTS